MRAAALLAALLMFPAAAIRAESRTPDDLAAQALMRNPALEAARLTWEAAKARAGGERSLPDPMIGADWERDNTRFGDRMDVEYMLQQDLPGWGKRSARVEAARLEAEAEGFRYLEAARSLRGQVAVAWWELWARTKTAGAMGGSVEAMRHMEEAAISRYESGIHHAGRGPPRAGGARPHDQRVAHDAARGGGGARGAEPARR
jgi:cobalt-zinc-cadmium efflux system outer membrane protein